jgi:basic amino acid/polyamine antiporter, APA family
LVNTSRTQLARNAVARQINDMTADLSPPPESAPALPRRRVSALYVAMVAVAMVVGAGIFKSPALVAENVGTAPWLFGAWIIGGIISLIGALCYAELSAAFPQAGGDYHFLKLAYGRDVAFVFAWARFAVINTGSIALLGFVLGDYLNVVIPIGPSGPPIYGAISVAVLTLFNLRGAGKGQEAADYGLTSLEVLGLVMVTSAAIWLALNGAPSAEPVPTSIAAPPGTFGLALVYALLAFGGWSEIATLSAEVKDAERGMVRALVLAIALITALYLLVNWAFWYGLGIDGLAHSQAPAADLMGKAFGSWAGIATAIAIAFAVITSINATIVVGARTTFACAQDWPALRHVAHWDSAREIPAAAIWVQGFMSLALVGLGAAYDGFSTLVDYTAPVFWLFLTLSGAALIILRFKHRDTPRPFRAPLYPILPGFFVLSSLAMLGSSLSYVTSDSRAGALVGIGVLASGILALIALRLMQKTKA